MSPAFSSGDPRILFGAVPGWEYRDDSETAAPLRLDPRPPGHVLTFAFSPGYPKDSRLLVGGTTPAPDKDKLQSSTVSVCSDSQCAAPTTLPGAEGTPTVFTSRSFVGTGEAYAWTGDRLFRSTDGGEHFKALALPAKGAVTGMVDDADGAVYVSLAGTDKGTPTGGLFVTRDSGKTWTQLGQDTRLAKGAASVTSLGKNRLLASLAAGGVLCSGDAGATWAKRCPAATS
jgi:hypothetical protein